MTNSKINSDKRFVRWQAVLRQHFTNINNLVLTISIGVVGFSVSLLNSSHFNPIHCEKLFFTFGLLLSFVSIILGFLTSVSRLHDFKTTVNKIKLELIQEGNAEISELKRLMNIYGKQSWRLFYCQTAMITLGVFFLSISFCLIYSDKLF